MSTFSIRDARPGDELPVAQVHVRTWQVAYRGLLPDAYLDALQPEDRARRYTFGDRSPDAPRTLVALDGPELIGFATVRVDPGEPFVGELAALYVEPAHWNRGAGLALIAAARARLAACRCRAARLWLLDGNHRGERFYRRDGWQPDGTRRSDRVWDTDVVELRFRRAIEPAP